MPDQRAILDEWRETAVGQWQDSRIVDAEWVGVHLWFFQHLYADLAIYERELTGFSFRQKAADWLMVVKVDHLGTQEVVFVSGQNPTRCMRKLRRLLRDGGCSFYPDRYA